MITVNLETKSITFHSSVKTNAAKCKLLRNYWLSCDGLDRYEFPIRTSLVKAGEDLYRKLYHANGGWMVEGISE